MLGEAKARAAEEHAQTVDDGHLLRGILVIVADRYCTCSGSLRLLFQQMNVILPTGPKNYRGVCLAHYKIALEFGCRNTASSKVSASHDDNQQDTRSMMRAMEEALMTNQAGNASNQPHRAARTDIPKIKEGTRIVQGNHDITVAGIASGGMGMVVWGPNQFRDGQMEAVKLPRPDRLAAADLSQRAAILAEFEQEALTWCHLCRHPCIVAAESLLRLRGLEDLPAIFMEYAPEGSLRDLLHDVHTLRKRAGFRLEAVFAWGQMIASALATIHQPARDLERPKPLVHCDLKPENVLLDERGWRC